VSRQALLERHFVFNLGLLASTASAAGTGPGSSLTLSLMLVELLEHSLVVLDSHIFRNAFHAKDLDVKASPVGQRVVDGGEGFFVDLAHVDAQASCGTQSAAASFALEVLGLLMVDENLEVVEVALAVVTPRPSKDLLDVRVIALLLRHRARLWKVD